VRRAALVLAALLGAAAASAEVPDGKVAARPRPTRVVVAAGELDAAGVAVRVAAGTLVAGRASEVSAETPRGKVEVTLAGDVALRGRIDARLLGLRVLHDADLLDPAGKAVGRARAGALVTPLAAAGERTLVAPVAPIRARLAIASDALGAAPTELVLAVPEGNVTAMSAKADLRPGVALDPGARVELLAKTDDGKQLRVRTYGAFVFEGLVAADRVAADAPPPEAPPPRGLTPTHEALVDIPVFADAAGKRRIGDLRGGALVTAGVEVAGPRVRVMTHGDVVAEVWVPSAGLRPLEASVWAEP
jgi:hypothetical protein